MKYKILSIPLFFSLLSVINAQWAIEPYVNNAVSTAASHQINAAIDNDGFGGSFIAWQDFRNGTDFNIYAQKIDSYGKVQWTPDGVPISAAIEKQSSPKIVNDGSEGAIIIWLDNRNGSESDIYAQKIDANGIVQWKTDGVPISTVPVTNFINIVNDGAGGAIITWVDWRNGSEPDIFAQMIDSSGEVQWETNGVPICIAGGDQYFPEIVNDGSGGAIITWYDWRKGIESDIYAQKINSKGQAQWATDGVPICIAGGDQSFPEIVNDGSGGQIITWQDYRNGSDYNIYAQMINSNGEEQWANNGVPISFTEDNQSSPRIVNDGSGGAIISWIDYRNGIDSDIFAQKINSRGQAQWPYNGVPICTAAESQNFISIAADGSGGAIISWRDFRNGNDYNIYAQKINSKGTVQWMTEGVPISTAPESQNSNKMTDDGLGGVIITWHDSRIGSGTAIFAQRIDTFGYLGMANPVLSSVKDISGDQGGMVSVKWSNSDYDIPFQELITYYSVWRGIETANGAALGKVIKPGDMNPYFSGKALKKINGPNGVTFWEWLGNIPAHYLMNYSYTAKTHSDSTSSGNYYHKFFVSAHTDDPFVFWDSKVDSGYSVDNLSPLSPQNIIAELLPGGNIEISWNRNSVDPDLNNYQVHRSTTEGFTPNESTLRTSVEDTVFMDIDVPTNINSIFYKIIAVDIHGNMSLPSYEISIILVNVDENKDLPQEYALNQNYPNPFNPATTIKYTIPVLTASEMPIRKINNVRLVVYDILGKEVATLVDEYQKPGNYEIEFSAKGGSFSRQIPSGIYFYKLTAGNFAETKKMILLK